MKPPDFATSQGPAPELEDIKRYGHPMVAAQIAGWTGIVPSGGGELLFLLTAIAEGVTPHGIEDALTRHYGRKHPMTLRHSPLRRSGSKKLDASAAQLAGHALPRTFGDLLALLVRLGVVAEQAGRYAVAFPPPVPEEVLPLTPAQRSHVLRIFRDVRPNTGGMSILEDCVRAEGPGFVPPAWMRTLLESQRNYVPEERIQVYEPPGTCIGITGADAYPALCEQLSASFTTYLADDPRQCPCGATINKTVRQATTNAEMILIEAWCLNGHFGYMGKRVREFSTIDESTHDAPVELFLQRRPDGESIQARDFYTHYVLWALTLKRHPASNVLFARQVMESGLYRRTDRRPGGRMYHRGTSQPQGFS